MTGVGDAQNDADTPRVPDLWWSPKLGPIRKMTDGNAWAFGVTAESWAGVHPWPADAVKLGDVGALRKHLVEMRSMLDTEMVARQKAERERDALRAGITDIRAVYESLDMHIGRDPEWREVLAIIERIKIDG